MESIREKLGPLVVKPTEIIKNLKVPTLFVAGEKDPMVYPWHTEELYKKLYAPRITDFLKKAAMRRIYTCISKMNFQKFVLIG